jgi:hypothetical protein
MGPGSENKKQYFPPTLTKPTPKQARMLVAQLTHRTEEEAADFLAPHCLENGKRKCDQTLDNATKPKAFGLEPYAEMGATGILKIGWKSRPYCGDHEVYRSRTEPLTWLD